MQQIKPKKYLLDSNVYGEMVVDEELRKVRESFEKLRKLILVYGINQVIRKELRNTPRKIKVEGKNLRNFLLVLYDNFTVTHNLIIEANVENIANAYYIKYREFGGSKSKVEVINDFLIVACASKKDMDIVVSQDEKSMRTENAVRAYRIVNENSDIRTPEFIDYEQFKRILRSESNKFIGSPDKFWVFLSFFNFLDYPIDILLSFFPFHATSKTSTDI